MYTGHFLLNQKKISDLLREKMQKLQSSIGAKNLLKLGITLIFAHLTVSSLFVWPFLDFWVAIQSYSHTHWIKACTLQLLTLHVETFFLNVKDIIKKGVKDSSKESFISRVSLFYRILICYSEVPNKRAGRLCSVFSLKRVLVY